jgi:hypothetical protein
LILVGERGGDAPSSPIFKGLDCQPDLKAHFDQQRVFPALSNLIVERDDREVQFGPVPNAPRSFLSDGGIAAPSALRRANLELLPNPFLEPLPGPIEREDKAAVGTIKIILRAVNQRGRSMASLPDGTVLIASSRHPYLDAARILIAAGHDPDSWLEGWRPGTKAFASRARLGIAARLTIDETKNSFAKWKAFSPSAVSSSIDYSQAAATPPSSRR